MSSPGTSPVAIQRASVIALGTAVSSARVGSVSPWTPYWYMASNPQIGERSRAPLSPPTHLAVREILIWLTPASLLPMLPGTIADRSLVVRMERKASGVHVARRDRAARSMLQAVKPRLARWAQDTMAPLSSANPCSPNSLSDRQRDICEPLLAIADHAGVVFPALARG